MRERHPPTPPFHCGENEIQASLISSASVGATPTPATNSGKCSGCRTVNAVSQKKPDAATGALPALPAISGPVAQSAERPVVCGRGASARPPGCNSLRVRHFSARSVAANALGLGPRDRRCNSCRADQFQMLPWSNTSGIRLLSGTMQVGILPAAPLPGSVKVARRPVKPFGVGASPTLAATLRKAGRYKLAAPVSKTGSAPPRSEHYRRLPPFCPRPIPKPSTKGNHMKPVIRYQSQLLLRRSYKPDRAIRIRPSAKPAFVFRPMRRFGSKPQLESVS